MVDVGKYSIHGSGPTCGPTIPHVMKSKGTPGMQLPQEIRPS